MTLQQKNRNINKTTKTIFLFILLTVVTTV